MKLISKTMDIYRSQRASAGTRNSQSPRASAVIRALLQSRAPSPSLDRRSSQELPAAPPPSPAPALRAAEGAQAALDPPPTQSTARRDSESTIPRKRSVEDDSPSIGRPTKAPCSSYRKRSYVAMPSSVQSTSSALTKIDERARSSLLLFATPSQATNQMPPPPPSGFAVGRANGGRRDYLPTASREMVLTTAGQALGSMVERRQHRQAAPVASVAQSLFPEGAPQVWGVAGNRPRVMNCEEEIASSPRNPNIQGSSDCHPRIPVAGVIKEPAGTDIGNSHLRLPAGLTTSSPYDFRQLIDFYAHPVCYRSSEGLASNPYLPLIQHAPVLLYPMCNNAMDTNRRRSIAEPEVPPSARPHSRGLPSHPNQDVQRRSLAHLPTPGPQEVRCSCGILLHIAGLDPNRYNLSSRVRIRDGGRESGASKSNSKPRRWLIEILVEDKDEDSEDDDPWEHEEQVGSFPEGDRSPLPRQTQGFNQGHPVEPQRSLNDLVFRQGNNTSVLEARSAHNPSRGPCQCSSRQRPA